MDRTLFLPEARLCLGMKGLSGLVEYRRGLRSREAAELLQ